MAQRFVNTFRAETPFGQGLQNLAAAMFAGKSPVELEYQEARTNQANAAAENQRASAAAAWAQAGSRATETRHFESVRNETAEDQDASFATGRPLPTVRAVRSYLMTGERTPEVTDRDILEVGNFLVNRRAGYADKTVNPYEIQRGARHGLQTHEWMRALTDPSLVRPLGRAQNALEGRGEFNNMEGGVFNKFDGDQSLNEIGAALAGYRQAQGRERDAAAGAQRGLEVERRAHAGLHGARTRQADLETRSGVKIGPPVPVDDIEVGPIYSSPGAAVGRKPAARPVDHRPQAPKAAGGAQAKPRKVTPNDNKFFNTALDEMLPELQIRALEPEDRAAIIRQAEHEYVGDSAIAHREAVRRALDAIAPQGFEEPMQWRDLVPFTTERHRPVGGARKPEARAAPQAAAPVAAGGELPPQARAKLREGVVTTFGNGQRWTLQGGRPVKVD